MEAYKLTCPHCGASLEPKDGLDTFFCSYCGGKIILDNMSEAAYKARVEIKNIEKEAEIHKQNLQHEVLMKDREMERRRHDDKQITKIFILMSIPVLLCILIPLIVSPKISRKENNRLADIESQINYEISIGNYDSALATANQLVYDSSWSSDGKEVWDSKRENYINIILEKKREADVNGEFIAMKKSSYEYEGEKYSKVMDELKGLGFKNVTAKESSEEKGFFDGDKTVEHITISGKTGFSKDETYDKNSAIVLYYYSKD